MTATAAKQRPVPVEQPRHRRIPCDAPVELLYGDPIPSRGVALLGTVVYSDGELLGECTLRETVLGVGPTGQDLDYQVIHWQPFDIGEGTSDGR